MGAHAGTIGWVGAGRMGAAMVRRLSAAGYEVAVQNRTRAKAEALAGNGVTVVDCPADLAGCALVFTAVTASDDLLAVTTGENGVLCGDSAPGVLVDCSTVSAESSARVRAAAAQRGSAFLTAPVSGNPDMVAAGTATFAVSGPVEVFERVRPLFEVLGDTATRVGDAEQALAVKLCHNMLLGVMAQALSEVTVLAERSGTSRRAFLEFLNESGMGSRFTRSKTEPMAALDFTPAGTPPLLNKDLELGLDAARELGVPMPMAANASQLIASAIGAGYVDEDYAVLLLEQARRSGINLTPE